MGYDQLPHEDHDQTKARRRVRRQRMGLLTYVDRSTSVIEELDATAEAERLVHGMLGRGQ